MPASVDVTEAKRAEFWSKVQRGSDDECWPWTGTRAGGYGRIYLGGRVFEGAHRVCWLLTHGGIPGGMQVLHRCDNPPCNNPRHLFLGTHQDNMDDRGQKGRTALQTGERNGMRRHPEMASQGDSHWSRVHPERRARGVGHGRVVLTEVQVREIRTLARERRLTGKAIADRFGVSGTHVMRIVRRKTWTHLSDV